LRRPRRGSSYTGGDGISDEKREGYVLDRRGKIRGEVKNYDPYSRFGHVMLYDIDVFGFVPGYISIKWRVMSEEDMAANKRLADRLYETKYQVWKRHNIHELHDLYEKSDQEYKNDFEKLCRDLYDRVCR
jgi:hypothetical protein